MNNETLLKANYLTKCISDIEKIENRYKTHGGRDSYGVYFAMHIPSSFGKGYKDDIVEIPYEAEAAIMQILGKFKKGFQEQLDQL